MALESEAPRPLGTITDSKYSLDYKTPLYCNLVSALSPDFANFDFQTKDKKWRIPRGEVNSAEKTVKYKSRES